jgi:AbrB family looped-hinge helix DNA binding protein
MHRSTQPAARAAGKGSGTTFLPSANDVARTWLTRALWVLSIADMVSVKVSTKHQIVVPSEARRSLGIAAGDRLAVEITQDSIILRPRPHGAGTRLRGLGREIWVGVDPVEYVRRIRQDWDDRIPR